MKLKITALLLILFQTLTLSAFSLSPEPDSTDSKYYDWYNKDPKEDKIYGVSTDKAYKEIIKKKESKTVIVAIIDSGIDIDHEDIKDKVWVNEDEIPGNGIDDDKNGYVDDIHGWNFLGNSNGENVEHETLELTRLYKKYNDQFKNRVASDIKPEEQKAYSSYLKIKEEYEQKLRKAEEEDLTIKTFERNFNFVDEVLKEYLKKEDYTLEDLKKMETDNKDLLQVKEYMISLFEKGFDKNEIKKYKDHYQDQLNYHLNTDFNPRTIIGDDPENINDSTYGNNDVEGASPEHGTHVAGIIGANRSNDLGIKGIAENVKLMALRAVPDGDERDKDIANAIKYAVNNGARIVNMSFGKSYSPQKEALDEAIKYAEERGVLLIHAAGNDASNIDTTANFPTKTYSVENNKEASNWITVGASSIKADESLPGYFSNFGKKSVDLFAPGVEIYSLKPNNGYTLNSGTSMACPVVSGVAALLMSYYPNFTAQQVKDILLKSSIKYKDLKVKVPSEKEAEDDSTSVDKVKFEELSQTGGVVNAYEALKLAEKYSKDKNKINKL